MIPGDSLMKGLLVVYAVIASAYAWEGNWPKVWYWISAANITGSVLVMR